MVFTLHDTAVRPACKLTVLGIAWLGMPSVYYLSDPVYILAP